MKLTRSQVNGFIHVMLGCETMQEGDGDYLSPLVAAYLSGVLPEKVCAYYLCSGPGGSDASNHERAIFCDFLEAVVRELRGATVKP